jgi:DNA-binding winged helix-turn-helix (wHTH) protein
MTINRRNSDDFPARGARTLRGVDLNCEPDFLLAHWQVRPLSREVITRDATERLEPRVMQVLIALHRREGEVVPRDELIQSCWGGTAVTDDALQRCVARLRHAVRRLGGLTIETISGVGYRLSKHVNARDVIVQYEKTEAEQVSGIISTVFDAVLDPKLWVQAVEQSCEFLNCIAGAVGSHDYAQSHAELFVPWGYEPHQWQRYVDRYFQMNPAVPYGLRSEIGEVLSWAGLDRYEEFLTTPFFKEWVEPQGFVDFLHVMLDKTPASVAILGCARHRDAGFAGEAEFRRIRLIAPHFRRAVLIGRQIDFQKIEVATFMEAIDVLSTAIFFVKADRTLVHTNKSGNAILEARDPFALKNGILVGADQNAHKVLTHVLRDADSDVSALSTGIALPLLTRGKERFVAHALSLNAGRRARALGRESATRALFVRKAVIEPQASGNG